MDERCLIITGASSGIGAALAKRFAGKVSGLVLHARSSRRELEAVAELAGETGTRTELFFGDLSDQGTATGMVKAAESRFGRLDGIAANAGFPVLKSLAEGSLADIEYAFRGNLFSFFELAKAGAPLLANAPSPRIVAVGSFTSHVFRTDIRQFPVSAASKGGLETAVRSLAASLSVDGITVNCVVPGFIRKDDSTRDGVSQKELAETARRIPLGRAGEPDEVAATIEFLMSAEATYITGQCLHVNGGLI
ncbi:SDR family NAD(P)-dependent oxidoreductase [Roseibium sp. SCP14]|uniref:SDR family NAD(P)-dependent oxidoreductase n=1 Tax=Roseibium sp. SCP14 TaxID=3141375 RepID=UPI003335CDA4